MVVTDTILEHLRRMPEPLQAEVLDFVQYLEAKTATRRDSTPDPGTGDSGETACSREGETPPAPLSALVGACKGMFETPEEADEFISRERDSWGS